MSRHPELRNAIAQTHLSTDGCDYVFLRFPLTQSDVVKRWLLTENTSFFCALCDDQEFSLMMKQEHWKLASQTLLDAGSISPVYKRITFDIVLDFDLVGYLEVMTRILASQNIAILTFSAFSRDHIFVQKSDFELAWHTLEAYILHSKENGRQQFSPETVSKSE